MRTEYHNELDELKKSLIKMGAIVEDILEMSLRAFTERDLELSQKAIKLDDTADELDLDIEKRCLDLIALQQPAAKDLRVVGSIIKIIADLERIGDYGVNIARETKRLGEEDFIKPLEDISKMAEITREMTRKSLDSFVNEDTEKAREVAKMDDPVDDLYKKVYDELLTKCYLNKENNKQVIILLSVGRYLERIGDHATNICERIIYMVEGKRVQL